MSTAAIDILSKFCNSLPYNDIMPLDTNSQEKYLSPRSYLIAAIGTIVCFISWPAIAFNNYLLALALLSPLVLTFYANWKRNLPFGTSLASIVASLLGIWLEAYREVNAIGDNPLIDDGDGLWILIVPVLVFWWLVAKTLGYVWHRRSQKKKGTPMPPMNRISRITVGVILLFGAYFFVSFIISTIKGSN